MSVKNEPAFRAELENLINTYSMENGSNTPDWILANFLIRCLEAFDITTRARDTWNGHPNLMTQEGE